MAAAVPQDDAPVPVGIILYVNRSGSTLLARMLAESLDGVFVFPELRFTLDLLVARRARRTIANDALLRSMHADPRLDALGLADDRIAACVARHGAGDLHGLLTSLSTALLGRRPAALILKLESYLAFVPELDAAFGAPVLIHALRDPRAVVRSMRATPVPEKPGFDMARGSLVYAARHWCDYVARVAHLAATRPVVTARYEALTPAVAEIAAALGVGVAARRGSPHVVAAIDAALHPNVDEPFDPALGEVWRTTLTAREIALIETLCAPAMAHAGYRPVARCPASRTTLRLAQLRHHAAMIRHAIRTAAAYWRRDGALRQLAARLRLARAAGRL